MRRVVARVVQALLGASAVAWLAYLGLPDGDGATEIEVSLAILAIAWLGVETVGRAATSAWRTYRFDHDANLRQGAENRLAEAFIEIIEIDVGTEGEVQHIHPAHFGLNAFAVRWTHRGRRELVRVARQRLRRYHPPPSPRIRWTKGKGLIGRCWATADLEIVETASAWQPYLACTRKRWRELDDDVTLDLKYGDFKALRTKYKGGMALPILGENRTVMGVVAIDLAPESPLQVKCLHRDAVARTPGASGSRRRGPDEDEGLKRAYPASPMARSLPMSTGPATNQPRTTRVLKVVAAGRGDDVRFLKYEEGTSGRGQTAVSTDPPGGVQGGATPRRRRWSR